MSHDARPMTQSEWQEHLARDPATPTDEAGLRALVAQLTGAASPDPDLPPEVASAIHAPCASAAAWRLREALRNPGLDDALRRRLEGEAFPAAPATVIQTAHFAITYTPGQGTGQVPTSIATAAGDDLETAYTVYSTYYGTAIVPSGTRCQVTFAEGVNYTTPDGRMQLSCGGFKLDANNPEARRLVAFHEAFHLLQFVSGFTVPYNEWFLEGTATWAEVAHGSDPAKPAVTSAQKLTTYWSNQSTPITNGKYTTLPFFINLVAVCATSSAPAGRVMKDIITTFKARYPSPGQTSVPSQIAQCASAYVTLDATITIEALWVNWLAKMAQGNWNVQPNSAPLYPTIYDASSPSLPPIAIPPLTVPAVQSQSFTDPGNDWSSSGTVVASKAYIARMQFQLAPKYFPPTSYEASVNPKSFLGTMSEPLSIFEYMPSGATSGQGPDVVAGESCERSYHDPQSALVYLVFIGEYNYSVQYEFRGLLTGGHTAPP